MAKDFSDTSSDVSADQKNIFGVWMFETRFSRTKISGPVWPSEPGAPSGHSVTTVNVLQDGQGVYQQSQGFGCGLLMEALQQQLLNGEFEEERNRVRLRLGRLGERYAFYSKIEVTLLPTPTSDEAIVELTEAFLQKILPVLMEAHWPDWPVTEPN